MAHNSVTPQLLGRKVANAGLDVRASAGLAPCLRGGWGAANPSLGTVRARQASVVPDGTQLREANEQDKIPQEKKQATKTFPVGSLRNGTVGAFFFFSLFSCSHYL